MDRIYLRMRAAALVILALVMGALGDGPAAGQQPVPRRNFGFGAAQPATEDGTEPTDGVLLPANRDLRVTMRRAEKALEDNRNADAVELLNSILQNSEDYFFQPDEKQPLYRSIKAEAQRLIGAMSPEGRQSYELQFGAEARRQLQNAIKAGDTAGIENVSRQFLHTDAGYDATLLLARHDLDHGRPLAAALCLARLQDAPAAVARFEPTLSVMLAACWQRSGLSEKAKETLVKLKENYPNAKLQLGGKPTSLFQDNAHAVSWLNAAVGGERQPMVASAAEQWALFRGNPARNAASAGGQPIMRPIWRQRTSVGPDEEKALLQMQKQYLDANLTVLPGSQPLAVRDVVLMRTGANLLAVDFVTGKRIWEVRSKVDSTDPGVNPSDLRNAFGMRGRRWGNIAQAPIITYMSSRAWDNATGGTLSSDGENVYSIEELPTERDAANPTRAILVINGVKRAGIRGAEIYNKLAARELRTQGKLKWEVGGATGEYEPQLAGAFFLGPPLPLQDRLYALVEMKSEIRLVVLQQTKDPQKPVRLEWSQQLAQVEQPISIDSLRRTAGATPSFADGVLVCPTAAGVVVGVDLTTRTLLWGYKYPRSQQMFAGGFPGVNFRGPQVIVPMGAAVAFDSLAMSSAEHWNDGCAAISDGRVLVTPVESDQLHCLSLVDGKTIWKMDRGENLYVACVYKDHVIVVGRREIQALRLSDGKALWKQPLQLPDGGMPSGRGFFSGDEYFLPLTTASVARIDLNEGAVKEVVKSRRGNIPGNLICYKGQVISLGVDFLEAYYQLEPLKEHIATELAANASDPEALALRGEIALVDGRLPNALADLRRSYKAEPRADTRDLLVEALLDALRADFAGNRDLAAELENMIELPAERASYLRLLATELRKAGEIRPAVEAYMKLSDLDQSRTDLEPNGPTGMVRRDRWIQTQLGSLLTAAGPEERAALDAAVAARFKLAVDAKKEQINALRNFLNCFGSHPMADQARELLVTKLTSRDALLEKELLLRRLELSHDSLHRRSGVARLAIMLSDASRWEEAAIYYRRLSGEFADQVCYAGKTGRQLVAEIPAASPLRRLLDASSAWPTGAVEVSQGSPGGPMSLRGQMNRAQYNIPLRGPLEPFFGDASISYDIQQLLVRGPTGKDRCRVNIQQQIMNTDMINRGILTGNYASVEGHLLVTTVGSQVLAIDTLRGDLSGDGVLWREDLVDQIPTMQGGRDVTPPQPIPNPWGGSRMPPGESGGQPVGMLGPVSDIAVCLQRSRDVYGLNPLTGETLWVQRGFTPGSELFGDDEYLFVIAPGASEATVLRLADGELLGKREVPTIKFRWGSFGRRILTWNVAVQQMRLKLRDVWEDKDIWTRDFPIGSKGTIVGEEAVGIMQPDGKFSLISLDDGRLLIDEQLEPEPKLKEIFILASHDQYHLVTSQEPQQQTGRVRLVPYGQNDPNNSATQLVTGHVYAFDRHSGRKQWPTPAEISLQGLLLQQPDELPVLTFFRIVYQIEGQGTQAPKAGVLCLDKQTGRAVYEKSDLASSGGLLFDLSGDVESHTVTLGMPGNPITLTFTDKPRPPEPPPQALTNAGADSRGPGRLGQAFLKALGAGMKAADPMPQPAEVNPGQDQANPPAQPANPPAQGQPF